MQTGILLPPGYNHKYQLHVIRDVHSDAGPCTGGGAKAVTHITVTDERHVHTAAQILVEEGFEPNLLVGYDLHTKRPYLYQFAPLNHASKALQHPAGTPETNRGGSIVCQLEIACQTRDVVNFPKIGFYRVLANVWTLVNDYLRAHAAPTIPPRLWAPEVSKASATRLSPLEYISHFGHGGHRNVPSQPAAHDDPTRDFDWGTMLARLQHGKPYDLTGTGF